MTTPNTVLVASAINSSAATPAVGDLILIDAAKGTPVAFDELATVSEIQFGVVKAAAKTDGTAATNHPAYIAKTKAFSKSELKNISGIHYGMDGYVAETEDSFKFTMPASMPSVVAGDKLHVRMNFKVQGIRTQKGEEYVFDLTKYTDVTDIAIALVDKINTNRDAWVTATRSGDVVTVTAKRAIDGQVNAKTINATTDFNQVEFDMAAYSVNGPSDYVQFGTVAKYTNANPGMGNPYVVRDEERKAFGYLGAMHSTSYPNIQPASSVATVGGLIDETKKYDSISVTAELTYRAADQSYMKSTPVSAQMYFPTSLLAVDAAAEVISAIKTWANIA
jgi:hypothetical protein